MTKTTPEQFQLIVDEAIDHIQTVLRDKAVEYSHNGDRLFNFRVTSQYNDEPIEKSIWGMASKHLTSVLDLVHGRLEPTKPMVDEKIGDMINYLILLKAAFYERYTNRHPDANSCPYDKDASCMVSEPCLGCKVFDKFITKE